MFTDGLVGLQPYDGNGYQRWLFEVIDATFYRIKNLEGQCLDVDVNTKQPRMNNCGDYGGEHWQFVTSEDGQSFKLMTNYTGAGWCLSITEGDDQFMQMTACDSRDTQLWQFHQAQ